MTGPPRWWLSGLTGLVLLLSGCSLPLSSGVHTVGEVVGEKPTSQPLQVIPPGPQPGATMIETVLGFLGAQASSGGRHAIARQFLTDDERARWQDEGEVQVYDPDRLELVQLHTIPGDEALVRVTSVVSGQVRADGSFGVRPHVRVSEAYGLVRVRGQWRLDHVPRGLRLSAADLQRAYAPRSVFYLAPASAAGRRLVPDQVFLPVEQDLATSLVTRLLQPPSQGLGSSVATAVPEGTRLTRVVESPSGLVTVDLRGAVARPTGQRAADLSAQLVWTLRALGASFHGLRLRLDRRPLVVPGRGAVQDASDWQGYDPDGLGANPPYYFTVARRLRSSERLPSGPATNGTAPVDVAAVTPDRTQVAVLERQSQGQSVLRVGRLDGGPLPVVLRGRLASPTWGAGDRGVWLVRGARQVVRVAGGVHDVPVVGLPRGAVTALAVSREGVRLALVVGGRLYVGRIEPATGGPRIVGLTLVLPSLHAVRGVAWASATGLVALGSLTPVVQVVQIAVDGSSVQALNTAGLEPTGLAASPAGVLVTSGGRLYHFSGGVFRQVQPQAASPAYPG